MTALKPPPKPKLNEALRANLRRRKAQEQARADETAADATAKAGVRYSGFTTRQKPPVVSGSDDAPE